MEQRNSNVLRLAVAACFGVVAGQAGAVATLGTTVGTVWGTEIPNNASLQNSGALGTLSIGINSVPGLVPAGATPLYVKVALLNGATWGAAPTLTCWGTGLSGSQGGAGTAVSAQGTVDLGGTVGGNSVTFRVTGAGVQQGNNDATAIVLNASGCVVSADSIVVNGLTTKTVSAQVEYTNGASPATTAQVGNFITFQRGLSTVVSAPATSASVVVDATSGSDNFVAGSNLTVGTAYVGAVYYGVNAATAFNSAGAAIEGSSAFSTAVLTVSGPALAASIARGVTGVYLSTANTCANTTVTAAYTTSPSATSVTFAGLTPTQLSAGVFICATVPGNTSITTGQLTATITATPLAATQTLDTSASSNNIANLTANGSTRNAYFVNASTSTSKTSVVRLINRGGVAGAITATAYDEAGTVVGTANASIGTLGVNQMLSKTSAELETAIGYTPASATAKYSIVFSGAVASFEVLNFSKDVAGGSITLSNTSTTDTK